MTDEEQIGELILRLMTAIEKLHPPIDPDADFGTDVDSGAVKYPESGETQRILRIKLNTGILDITESGRDFNTKTSNLEAWFDGKKVFQAKLSIKQEDEHDWHFEHTEALQLENGLWMDEISATLKRLDSLVNQ